MGLTKEQRAAAVRQYMAELGRKGGKSRSKAKLAAVRQNFKKAARINRQLARKRKKAA